MVGGSIEPPLDPLLSSSQKQKQQVDAVSLSSDYIFANVQKRISSDPQMMKKINGVLVCKITKEGKVVATWTVDLKIGEVYRHEPKQGVKADTTVTIDDTNLVKLITGKLSPQGAVFKGKIKINGNMDLAMKFKELG